MKLTAAQKQAIKTLSAQFAPDAQVVFATYDKDTGRMISRATMQSLVDKGVLKVKGSICSSRDVKGRFGRGATVSTRYQVEGQYVWAK
jgi:hypothetical protein